MRTVQLIYIILIFSCAPEAESKLWILKLFQKAANSIRGMKEGSAAASAVAVAAVGGGAVADTIVSMNAEEKTPIAGAQKTISDDILGSSIVNNTANANETILSIEGNVDTDNDNDNDSSSSNNRGTFRRKPPANTRLVEIEVPCDSKIGPENRPDPVESGFPDETVGRHSHRWFEKFYGQKKRVCKTFVEVPIPTINIGGENDSNQNEMPQTNDEVNSDRDQDVAAVKTDISESSNQNINAGVTNSYEDIYIRPIMKFNQDVQNSASNDQNINADKPKSYDNVYIRPIIKLNQVVTQPSQPYRPYNNVYIRPIMKFNQGVTQPSQPKIHTESHVVPNQPQSTVGIAHAENFESEDLFVNNTLPNLSEDQNEVIEINQTAQPQYGTHTLELQNSSEQPQTTFEIAHAEEPESEHLLIGDHINNSTVNMSDVEEIKQTTQPTTITRTVKSQIITQTLQPQTVAQTLKPQKVVQTVEPQIVSQTIQPQTSTYIASAEVKQADQDVPKYSYMRNKRINGHDIEQDEYSSKENILFTSGVKVSQSSVPWIVIALAVLFGVL